MALIPTGYIDQKKLADEVERAKQRLGPEVVRVRHSIGADNFDDPSINFGIVLTDAASKEETLAEVTGAIARILFDELRPYENWGLKAYFSFRSQSEKATREDPAWA